MNETLFLSHRQAIKDYSTIYPQRISRLPLFSFLSSSSSSSSSSYSFILDSLILTGGVGGESTWKQLGGQCQASPHHLFSQPSFKGSWNLLHLEGGIDAAA
jgi:hypothetical protein